MKYEKPELTSVGCAVAVVQGSKVNLSQQDSQHQVSIAAYEADE